jgi:hypothetical protein
MTIARNRKRQRVQGGSVLRQASGEPANSHCTPK